VLALVDLRSHRVVSRVTVPLLPLVIAFGHGSAWVDESDASA
jgi:hypothetical protein